MKKSIKMAVLTAAAFTFMAGAGISVKAADSVVEITTESVTTGEFLQQSITQGAGSGVIISTDGRILK